MQKAVITGAFSYTGSAVAQELLRRGWRVHTLTNRSTPPESQSISTAPLRFERQHLERELSGADLFINTYSLRYACARCRTVWNVSWQEGAGDNDGGA